MDRNINICYCFGINSGKIIDKVEAGCTKFSDIKKETGLGCGCGRCEDHGREIFKQVMEDKNKK